MWGKNRRQWRALGYRGGGSLGAPTMVRSSSMQPLLGSNSSAWRHSRRPAVLPRDRGNQSFYAVVFFALLFAIILTFEVFFINEDDDYNISPDFNEHELELLEPHMVMREPQIEAERNVANAEFVSGTNYVDKWQPVVGTREKFYVYAAYYDGRRGRFIRVVSATRTRGSDRVLCKYWYTNGDPPVIVGATNKVIRENWNLKYSAHFVLCPLFLYNVGRTVNVPDELSVLARPGDEPGNRLKVRNLWAAAAAHAEPSDGFAVCVKPLHYQFNRALQLIEFIELNRLLGVEHFTLYNHTIGKDAACVLRQYQDEKVVSLLPWQLDMESQKEIRTEGLFAALNDCLYRNMYQYRYLLMIDLDEYIVPHRNDSLRQMVAHLMQRVDPKKVGSFSFMNSFFYLQWPNDSLSEGLTAPLVSLTKTRRRAKFHPHKQRSKCIVLPEYVIEMGNHFVWEFLPGHGTINSPPDVGFLHHYRVCEFGGSDCIKTQWVTDRTMYKFKDEIIDRVNQRLDSVKKSCAIVLSP
uniref:Glycosyltransferase family 92 protein n=1 Tax=Strigamia maritima TaxID=126957 RepID=T1J425_STRMM